MASESGPFIVKDGLVLSLDAANERSFRGEPTVNLLNVNMLSWTTQVGATVVLRDETHLGNPIYRVTFPQASLPRIFTTFVYASGEVFTGHFYYRHVGENPNEALPGFWFRENGFGATHASISMPYTTEFTFRQLTHTFSSGGTSMFLLYRSNSSTTTPVVMDFSMPQLEKKPYPTPWVNGTRGTTVATGGGWADLSKNNNHGEILNGVGYNSSNGGSLVFDGVDDYINLSGNPQWNMFASPGNDFSISCIIQPKSIGSDQALVSQRHGDRMSLWLMSNGKVTFEMDDTQTYVGTNTVLQNNTWYNVTIAFYNNSSESFVEYYINGKFERSEGKWDGNGSVGGSDLWIGWQSRTNYGRNPSHFTGNITQVSIYNRALTPQEIRQNFISTRRRFGL